MASRPPYSPCSSRALRARPGGRDGVQDAVQRAFGPRLGLCSGHAHTAGCFAKNPRYENNTHPIHNQDTTTIPRYQSSANIRNQYTKPIDSFKTKTKQSQYNTTPIPDQCDTNTTLAWRRTQPYAIAGDAVASTVFCGAPCGATTRVRGAQECVVWKHARPATEAFGGAPYGATRRVRGVPGFAWRAHADTREDLRWSPRWGHEICEGCAEMWVRRAHAGPATGAFGVAPHGSTKLVRGVPKWVWGAHAGGGTWAFGGAPHGATKRGRCVPKFVVGRRASPASSPRKGGSRGGSFPQTLLKEVAPCGRGGWGGRRREEEEGG